MKTGRPPSWNPVAALCHDVWTDVVPLASKGRIVVPVSVRSRLPWLANQEGGLLGIVEAGRFAELLPWEPHGRQAMDAVRRAIDTSDAAERGELALAAMDRYLRLTADGAGRTLLPGALVSHLDAEASSCVRVVMRDARLWLWSEREWQAERARRVAWLAEREALL